jgi:hypothetical protein
MFQIYASRKVGSDIWPAPMKRLDIEQLVVYFTHIARWKQCIQDMYIVLHALVLHLTVRHLASEVNWDGAARGNAAVVDLA